MNRTLSHGLIAVASLVSLTLAAQAQRRGPGGAGGPAQGPQGSISGTIIDSTSGEPLQGASIALRNAADSSLVTGAIADKGGSFSITGLRPGRYYARVSFVGYVTRFVDIAVMPGSPNIALGKVELRADAAVGREVSITAKREFMTQAIDRTVYRTADLTVASGGTATDILRNLPSVEVDVDGKVSLRGNQNVVIQINGRPSMLSGDALAAFLRGLPANSIERVEVIPNPSAKYDPDGMSGIINIVMKQDSNRGLSGGVNGSIGTRETYNVGGNISYGAGPLNVFASYGFNYGNRTNEGTYSRESRFPTATPFLDQTSDGTNRTPSHALNGSIDYSFDPSNTLSFSTVITKRDAKGTGNTLYYERDSAHALVNRSGRSSTGTGDGFGTDYRLSYKKIFEPTKHEWTAEARYATDNNDDANSYLGEDLAPDGSSNDNTPDRQSTHSQLRFRNLTAQTDYMQTFDSDIKVEAGYKWDFERLNSEFYSESFDYTASEFRPDMELNNTFAFERETHSVYANVGDDFGALSAQAGVRLEQALTTFDLTTTASTYRNDYFSIFPSGFLMYRPTDGTQLKLSYSKRINRPSTWTLNPFVSQDDPLLRRSGNPYLRPEYTHAFELSASGYTEKSSLTITPYFRRTTDVMRRIARTDTNGVTTVSFENLATNDSWGAEMVGTIRVSDWFNGMLSGGAFRYITDASNVDDSYSNNSFGWNMRANASFVVMQGLDLQVTYFYRAPMNVEGGKIGSFSQVDLAITQKLFNDRGRVGLRVTDPFNTNGFNIWRTTDLFYQELHHKWASRNAFLTFSYTFGTPDRTTQRRTTPQSSPSDSDMMGM